MAAALGSEHGAGLLLAVVLGAILMVLAAMMTRLGWDTAAGGEAASSRVVATAAATSGAAASWALVRAILTQQLPQNILDQGCRQQAGISCTAPGYDTAGTSGVRRERIAQLAAQSASGWEALQQAFAEVFRQVMPVAPATDPYRTPTVLGYGGAVLIQGELRSGERSAPWRSSLAVSPIPGRPIRYDSATRQAIVPFEARAYGWAFVDARTGRRVTAQTTAWATNGAVTMTYPACPDYWQPDAICAYPEAVTVELPPPSWLVNDPAVRWGW